MKTKCTLFFILSSLIVLFGSTSFLFKSDRSMLNYAYKNIEALTDGEDSGIEILYCFKTVKFESDDAPYDFIKCGTEFTLPVLSTCIEKKAYSFIDSVDYKATNIGQCVCEDDCFGVTPK